MPGSVTIHIERARQGDATAKAWLWERYVRFLYVVADRHADRSDVSDVVQESGIRMLRDEVLANVTDRKHFQNLLRRIVRGKASDLRDKRREVQHWDETVEVVSREPPPAALDEMNDRFDELPPHLRSVAEALLEAETEQGAADLIGKSRHWVRQRLEEIRELWAEADDRG